MVSSKWLMCGAGIALMSAAALSGSASAAIYTFSYTGNGISTQGTFTTSDALTTGSDGRSGFELTSIAGTHNADMITGIADDADFVFSIDNRYYLDFPPVSADGIGFKTATNTYNLYYDGVDFNEYEGSTGISSTVGTPSIKAVAAPGAPAPLIGLGLLPALAGLASLTATRWRRVVTA